MIIRNVTEQLSDNSKEPSSPFCTIHNFKSYDSSVIQNHNRFTVFQISQFLNFSIVSFSFSNLSLFKFLNCLIQFLSSLIYTFPALSFTFSIYFILFYNSLSLSPLSFSFSNLSYSVTQINCLIFSYTLYNGSVQQGYTRNF